MKQLNPQISWKMKGIYKSYNPTSKRWNLRLTEKLEILDDPDKNFWNLVEYLPLSNIHV